MPPCRITPARAGNTQYPWQESASARDHPRACGEHMMNGINTGNPIGSPPRVRGIPDQRRRRYCWHRITPARAGNTGHHGYPFDHRQDHPRACGEHANHHSLSAFTAGSPPRVRGTPDKPSLAADRLGITPARAGNTSISISTLFLSEDHPRACGEHKAVGNPCRESLGSPPRVRGTHLSISYLTLMIGITPARAGNT